MEAKKKIENSINKSTKNIQNVHEHPTAENAVCNKQTARNSGC